MYVAEFVGMINTLSRHEGLFLLISSEKKIG